MRRSRALLLATPLLLLPLLPALPASADPPPPASGGGGFTDTFDSNTLDPANWQLTLGTAYPGGPAAFGTGEIETNTADSANVSVHDGSLYITPQRDSSGAWTSARVESVRADFKPAPGQTMTTTFTAAFPDLPPEQAQGYWPALWMNGSPYRADRWSWPAGGEFDIGETVSGGSWSNSVLHCGFKAQWGGPCNEPSGINAGSVPLPTAWGSFNDYSFQWDRTSGEGHDQLRWYHNTQLTQTVNQADLPQDVWSSLSDHEGYYLIMNVAIDGAYPAAKAALSNAATTPGVPMRVDSVSVSYTAGTTTPPPPTTPTTDPSTPAPPATSAPLPSTPPAPTPTATEPPASTPAPTTTAALESTPVTATGLQITDVSSSQLTLSWPAVPGATSYEILRAGIPLQELTTPAPTLSATNTGLSPNTPYIYSVRALPSGQTTPEVTVQTPAS